MPDAARPRRPRTFGFLGLALTVGALGAGAGLPVDVDRAAARAQEPAASPRVADATPLAGPLVLSTVARALGLPARSAGVSDGSR